MRKTFCLAAFALALLALPTLASDLVIDSGIDVWWTPADHSTRADFQGDPIPAGFFCRDSRPFHGSITFAGAPIATEPPNILQGADTVIHRLDDVAFDGAGIGETRVQVAALHLVSMAPVETRCGLFDVRATLVGEQPVTTMQIDYDGLQGGAYAAPLSLITRLTFTPVGEARGLARQIVKRIELDAAPDSVWTREIPGRTRNAAGFVAVDTVGDGRPDTLLPGTTSTFFADGGPSRRTLLTCHSGGGHQHCYVDECAGYDHCP